MLIHHKRLPVTETSPIDWAALRPRVRLSIESSDGSLVVSESLVDVLQAVAEHKTLVAAARSLRIPYRTARHRMLVMEARLGVRLFETGSGGAGGGFSNLTPAAQDILRLFGTLRDALDPLVDDRFGGRASNLDELPIQVPAH